MRACQICPRSATTERHARSGEEQQAIAEAVTVIVEHELRAAEFPSPGWKADRTVVHVVVSDVDVIPARWGKRRTALHRSMSELVGIARRDGTELSFVEISIERLLTEERAIEISVRSGLITRRPMMSADDPLWEDYRDRTLEINAVCVLHRDGHPVTIRKLYSIVS